MKNHPIATIVNFCSNEKRFIKATLEQALLFSKQVIVPVCDHFFNGVAEHREVLDAVYAAFPSCLFIEYPFIPSEIPAKICKKIPLHCFWHSCSRLIGYSFLDEEIEEVLFLDADEVPEGARFAEWLSASDYRQNTALKLSNYWYFREATNQALNTEDSIVLVQKKALDFEMILNKEERDAIYNLLPGPKRRGVMGLDGTPMFHHYSWVRTQDEMLQKVRSWSHQKDRDWEPLVCQEFSRPFQGTDFIHGYQYRSVESPFPITFDEPRFEPKGKPQVKKLTSQELLKIVKRKKMWNLLDF